MNTALEPRAPVRAALAALVDYAGLFPPARLGMDEALAEYVRERGGSHAWMLGRFIVPASRAPELLERLAARRDAASQPLRLSVIADADPHPKTWFGSMAQVLAAVAELRANGTGTRVEVLEATLPALVTLRDTHDAAIGQFSALLERAGLRDLPAYVEMPRDGRWRDALDGACAALARYGMGAKLRCGGLSPDAFPSVDDVAAFLAAANAHGVPFKATAGLHHPVRHENAQAGAVMHGFLNLLAAAALAPRLTEERLRAVLDERDPKAFSFDGQALHWREEPAGTAQLEQTRARAFVAYGSCSFREPVDDLTALHVLPAAR